MKVKKAVIPAAGLGTRMLPATKTIPKEMLPIIDKPSIQYIVEEAVASGIEDIVIITSRSKTVMDDYFDYSPELEAALLKKGKQDDVLYLRKITDMANIIFLRQKETKGLGHAVWTAKSVIGNEPFAVLLGDDIMVSDTPVTKQLIDVYNKYTCSAVGVKEVSSADIASYCSLDVNNLEKNIFDVLSLIEKPKPHEIMSNFAILGRYVLTPDIFNVLENTPPGHGGEIQLTDALNLLCKKQRMLAVDFCGKRFDTGNLAGYLETIIEFGLKNKASKDFLASFIIKKAEDLKKEL